MIFWSTITRRLFCTGFALWVLVSGECGFLKQSLLIPVSYADSKDKSASSGNTTGKYDWLFEVHEREYVLDVGDVFDLSFFAHPELNDGGVIVRPDGRITAPLIGDIMARGRTLPELKAALVKAYTRGEVRQPVITVSLRESAGLRVYVGGEVNNPGIVTHAGRLSLSQAILEAGGPKRSARMRNVVVLRRSEKGDGTEPLFAVVDLEKILAGGRDPLLQPYDGVYVPRSKLAKFGDFLTQAGFEYLFWGALWGWNR